MARRASNAASTVTPWPLLIVAAGVAVGLGLTVVSSTSWRLGAIVVGASVGAGALIRLILPDRQAGLLRVRSKRADVFVLAVLGVAIIVLALTVKPGR